MTCGQATLIPAQHAVQFVTVGGHTQPLSFVFLNFFTYTEETFEEMLSIAGMIVS